MGTKDYAGEKPLMEEIDKLMFALQAEQDKGAQANKDALQSLQKKIALVESKQQELIVPSEFDEIYQKEGAEGLNAFTSQDFTGFVVNLPANKWELWPILESDRMANPVLREFYKERDVVMEERRMRYENSAEGKLWESFVAAAYTAHPYGVPTIGWAGDIQRLLRPDAEDFFRKHYSPNNAVVAIVGDVRAEEVVQKLEKYFANTSSQTVPESWATPEPEQSGPRRATVYFDAQPSLMMGFHKPNPPHPDNTIIDLIAQLLERGRTSRFYRNVVEKKIAVSTWASNGNPGERYPNMIIFGGSPKQPYTNQDLENAIWKELRRLQTELVPEHEIQKIRNQISAEYIRALASNNGMASQLAYNEAILGDWQYMVRYLEELNLVTPEKIQRVAKEVFQMKNFTSASLQREDKNP